jgi:adenylate cyclase
LQRRALDHERARSEALLLNILPGRVAQQLKQAQGRVVENFESASVLFADIVGFTSETGRVPANELIDFLDSVFTAMDEIADQYGLEKIKTIGDSYMAVAGVPSPRADHAQAAVDAGLAMLDLIQRSRWPSGAKLELRVGVHSGPVVGGVIGKRKFAYDLWGDTVNVAARMESQGVPGHVQISETTFQLLAATYHVLHRGPIELKGKGPSFTYLVCSRSPAERSALNASHSVPGRGFSGAAPPG